MAVVGVREVHKGYTLGKMVVPALRGVSLDVGQGDFLCIVGPSGCGKTTLLNLVGCIDEPSSGTVLIDGEDVAKLSDDKRAELRLRKIGFIFQTFNLVPTLTALENVEFPLRLSKLPKVERRRRAEELLDAVGLSDQLLHRPDEMSGGQRQRVAVARALVNRPELVIADEPTANLDSENGDAVVSLMRDLNERRGTSFIFSTHNPEIRAFAKRTVVLRDGLVVAEEGGVRVP